MFLVIAPVQSLDLFGPLEVFHMANHQAPLPLYDIDVFAWDARAMRTESSLSIRAHRRAPSEPPRADTLVVVGGYESRTRIDPRLDRWLKRASKRTRRIASICVGAFFLGRAGLLEGRAVTTHWLCADELASEFPAVRVNAQRIWMQDGPIYTSAGITAGIDLALALVAEDAGHEVALGIARMLVVFLQRPGSQAQFSVVLKGQRAETRALRDLQAYIVEHPAEPHTVTTLAERVAMSPRNFTRVFTREVGSPPARFVARVRIEAAQRLLEQSSDSIENIAEVCGFESLDVMIRTFRRIVGVTPARHRQRFQTPARA